MLRLLAGSAIAASLVAATLERATVSVFCDGRSGAKEDWHVEVTNTADADTDALVRGVVVRLTSVGSIRPLLSAQGAWARSVSAGSSEGEWVLSWVAQGDAAALRPGESLSLHFLTTAATSVHQCAVLLPDDTRLVVGCTNRRGETRHGSAAEQPDAADEARRWARCAGHR